MSVGGEARWPDSQTGVLAPWFKKWRSDAVSFMRTGTRDLHLGRGRAHRPDTLMQTGKIHIAETACGRGGPYVFKSLLCGCVFLGVRRPRLQPGQVHLTKPLRDRSLMNGYQKVPRDLLPQIDTPPPHDVIHDRIRPGHHQLTKLGHLHLVQQRRWTRTDPRRQARHAVSVIAMHPVAQCLPIHAVHLRGLCARTALQYQRKRKQPPDDLAVLLARCQAAQIGSRMIRVCDGDRLTHIDPRSANRAQVKESHAATGGNPPREVTGHGPWY